MEWGHGALSWACCSSTFLLMTWEKELTEPLSSSEGSNLSTGPAQGVCVSSRRMHTALFVQAAHARMSSTHTNGALRMSEECLRHMHSSIRASGDTCACVRRSTCASALHSRERSFTCVHVLPRCSREWSFTHAHSRGPVSNRLRPGSGLRPKGWGPLV